MRVPATLRGPALIVLAALIVGLTVIYGQVAGHDFVIFDDQAYVTQNPVVNQGLTWSGFRWAFTTTTTGNWFPATWLSHLLDVELFGRAPRGHHLTNLVFHGVNAALVWVWLWGMTGAAWRSALVAGLFAFHPINVESVAWVAERKNVLSTLFLLLTLVAYVHYVRRPGILRYVAVFLSLAASLLAKPMAVTVPLLLLLLDFWPLDRFPRLPAAGAPPRAHQAPPLSMILLEKIPLLSLSVLSGVITYRAQAGEGAVEILHDLTPAIRCSNATVSTLLYIRKAFWPVDLACFYPHPEATLPLWQGLLAGAVIVAVAAAVLSLSVKRPFLAVGWFWFLGSLVPVLGFVQVGWQAMADRYAYVPLIGFFVAISWLLAGVAARRTGRRIIGASAVLTLVTLALTARVQAGYWQDTITLSEHAIAVTERNWLAHSILAEGYAARGDMTKAFVHMGEAMRLNRRYAVNSSRNVSPKSSPRPPATEVHRFLQGRPPR